MNEKKTTKTPYATKFELIKNWSACCRINIKMRHIIFGCFKLDVIFKLTKPDHNHEIVFTVTVWYVVRNYLWWMNWSSKPKQHTNTKNATGIDLIPFMSKFWKWDIIQFSLNLTDRWMDDQANAANEKRKKCKHTEQRY